MRPTIDRGVADLQQWLGWLSDDAERWNTGLDGLVGNLVRVRRSKLLDRRHLVAELGIPVRRRADPPVYSVPATRHRVRVAASQRVTTAFAPEPVLAHADYEETVRVLLNVRNQLERTPTTAAKLNEEEIRDLLLVALNGQFEGQAGGELFNGSGKTDIVVRMEDRNVFIGERNLAGFEGLRRRAAVNSFAPISSASSTRPAPPPWLARSGERSPRS